MFPQSQTPEQIGPYKILGELGRGSMGTVYLATQESLGRQIALKLLGPEFTRDPEFLERFRREGRTGASLRHPNIVQVFDLGESQGLYYIAMEYGGSKDLKQVLHSQGGRIPLATSLRYAQEILSALEHAHSKGIVHRDVKPANIMISDDDHAILTDFSVAQMKMASRLTQTGAAVGTPEYMAPEQFEGQGIDGRSDQYALGIILYEMLTGVQPFHGETVASVMKAQLFNVPPPPKTLNPDIPDGINAAIMKALEKDSNKRFSDANLMSQALQAVPIAPVRNTPTFEVDDKQALLDNFLAAVASGQISLDEANAARDQVKAAIDMGYRKVLSVMALNQTGTTQNETTAYFRSAVNNLLQKHGVTNFDWSPDGAICLFQEPVAAVRAAVQIQQLISQAAERRPELSDKVKTRIGVFTGEVYLDSRRSLGEFADTTVDTASQMAKDCPVGQILVGEVTRTSCKSEFDFKDLGLINGNVKVFQVVLAPSADPAPPEKLTPDPNADAVPPKAPAVPTAPRFCPGCAKPIEPGLRVCSQCGYEVGSLVPKSKESQTKDLPSSGQIAAKTAEIPISEAPEAPVAVQSSAGPKTLPNEAIVPKGARLDLSGVKASTSQEVSPAHAIRNAPKGFVTGPIEPDKASKPERPQQSLFERPALDQAPPETKKAEVTQKASSPYAEFVVFTIKALGISGFACLALSFIGHYLRYRLDQKIWMSIWLAGSFGLPCLAVGAFGLFLVSLFVIRDTQTTVRSLMVSIGLAVGAVVSLLMHLNHVG